MSQNKNDRKFMEIAVEEMLESRSEHINKNDPMVGAVLINAKGVLIDKTSRGSLRIGEHAEYILIERIQSKTNLEGSTLYVTLEPCVLREPPKDPCVKWILSARIRRVVVGIPDPNPDILGKGIKFLIDHGVEVDFFDLDLIEKIKEENKVFIEEQSKREAVPKEQLLEFGDASETEIRPVEEATIDDLYTELIIPYLRARNVSYEVPSDDLWSFLKKNGFLAQSKITNKLVPTVAGILLFAMKPEDFLPQNRVMIEAQFGSKIVSEELRGPLLILKDLVEDFFDRNVRTFTEIREFERVKIPEYPKEAFREAIINAVAHRDYRAGARIIVKMHDDGIRIMSPGLLFAPLTLEKIRSYNAPPFSRNARIALTLNYLNLMEEKGSGLWKMRDLLEENGLPAPQFDIDSGYFVVTFSSSLYSSRGVRLSKKLLAKLSKDQKDLVELIIQKERISTSEYAEDVEIDKSTARRRLNTLERLGIIEKSGIGRSTHYILKES